MKQVYKDSRKAYAINIVKRLVLISLLTAVLIAVTVLPQRTITGASADFYCSSLFPIIAFVLNSLSNFWIISLTENALVVLSITALILLVLITVRLVKQLATGKDQRGYIRRMLKIISWALIVAIILMADYQLMHGLNYNRTSVEEKLDMEQRTEYDDYLATLNWAFAGMVSARAQLGEDYMGVAHMSTSFDECVYDANAMVNAVSDTYGLAMSENYIRAKAVALSNLWSYTDITGVYSVLIGESNINTDYLDILEFPLVLCHEISHAKGYAREYDCNMIAVLACISSTRADFRYAGFYYIFVHLYPDVIAYAQAIDAELYDYAGDSRFDAVWRDMQAQNDYENSLEDGFIPDLIEKFSEDTNDAFLEANGQAGGTSTYYIHTNFYVDFYNAYVRTSEDA